MDVYITWTTIMLLFDKLYGLGEKTPSESGSPYLDALVLITRQLQLE